MSVTKEHAIYSTKPADEGKLLEQYHQEYADKVKSLQVVCPACKHDSYSFAFDKYGFHYVQCNNCKSLYVQNVLQDDDIQSYENDLQTSLYTSSAYQNYVQDVSQKVSFELEVTFSRLFTKQQSLSVAYFGNKKDVYKTGLNNFTLECFDTNDEIGDKTYDLIIVDHFLEKSHSLDTFVNKISQLLSNDGFLYITMRVGSGIDILTLWEDAKVYPLEHNVLCSIDGIKYLLNNNSLSIKELNTPGILDVDNILQTNSNNIPRFLMHLKESNNDVLIDEFQKFIQKNLLSSFATVIATKD